MSGLEHLLSELQEKLREHIASSMIANNELTLEIPASQIVLAAEILHEHPDFLFEMLMDLCGVDYSQYGISEWETANATRTGFSRGTEAFLTDNAWHKPRFAVVYHLLSITHNHRLRLRVFAEGDSPSVPSVIRIWNSANWYEREAFDLFGIFFEGHPDLRRILTDYGFIGHPFRKDFPLIGNVEMRYSAKDKRVVYEPVSIEPRTLVPKTIREDNRYLNEEG